MAIAILVLVGIAIAAILYRRSKSPLSQKNFNGLILETFYNTQPDYKLESKVGLVMMRNGYGDRAMFYRDVQLLRDGIYHALNSKNLETAESRHKGWQDAWNRINGQASLVSRETFAEITHRVEDAESQYATALYINIAKGLEEKALKLKTDKSRHKHIQEAINALEDGMKVAGADMAALEKEQARLRAELL
jgi:hypothetical protein